MSQQALQSMTHSILASLGHSLARQGRLVGWLIAGASALALTACQQPGTWTSFQTSSSSGSEAMSSWSHFSSSAGAASGTAGTNAGFLPAMEDHAWTDGLPYGTSSLSQVSFASEGADFDPEIDPTGTWMVYASTQHAMTADIYRKKVDGQTLTRLSTDPGEDVMPTISPDGKWIAFASNRAGNWDIWMMSSDGGTTTQLTSEADHELHPSFSPDGTQISYCRRNEYTDRWEIWTFDITKPGRRTYVCDGLFPQWCPDRSRSTLLFQRARERGSRYYGIWTIDFENGYGMRPTEIVAASDAAIMHPDWSPDGEFICFSTVADPQTPGAWPYRANVWMIGVDGTGRAPLTASRFCNTQPTWSADGRIYFVSDRGGNDSIWAVPATIGSAQFDAETMLTVEETDASD